MGISLFSRSALPVLLAPLQALAAWWSPSPAASKTPLATASPIPAFRRASPARYPAFPRSTAPVGRSHPAQKACQTARTTATTRRLKIVREFDAGVSPSCAGRMVISGRMADVCAELDRMAQKESSFHAA